MTTTDQPLMTHVRALQINREAEIFFGVKGIANCQVDNVRVMSYLPDMRLAIADPMVLGFHKMRALAKDHYVLSLSGSSEAPVWRRAFEDFAYTVRWRFIDEEFQGGYGGGVRAPQKFGDVGHDLVASEYVTIMPGTMARVPANVAVELPPTLFGWITARSSFAARMLHTPNGIIDSGYRGPLFAQIMNLGNEPAQVIPGDRFAQIIFQRVEPVQLRVTREFTYPTERGDGGFGSTGT